VKKVPGDGLFGYSWDIRGWFCQSVRYRFGIPVSLWRLRRNCVIIGEMETLKRTLLLSILILFLAACGSSAEPPVSPADGQGSHPAGGHAGGAEPLADVALEAGKSAPTSEPAAELTHTPERTATSGPAAVPSPTAAHVHAEPSPTLSGNALQPSPTPGFEVPLDLVLLEPAHQSVTKNTLFRLSWQAYPGAAYYEVLLLHDHAHAFLDHERVEGTSFAFSKAQQPGDYDWVVEAFNTAGEKIASSPGWYFSVEP